MNRNTTIVLALIIVSGLALGVIFVLPVLVPPPAMSTLIEFHDKDGNLIDVPMAIQADGAEVTTMTVTASWTVEHENIQEGTFNMNGVIKISIFDNNLLRLISLSQHEFDSPDYVSSESYTWVLADLLANRMSAEEKELGWALEIKAVFTPTATDLEGSLVAPSATTTDPISATLSWSSQTGALSIVQCAITKAYP